MFAGVNIVLIQGILVMFAGVNIVLIQSALVIVCRGKHCSDTRYSGYVYRTLEFLRPCRTTGDRR
jgi:hypothetical protein